MVWTAAAGEDFLTWRTQNRRTLEHINALIQDALRKPFEGIGKPEALREDLSGFWSRRIDDQHRLIYAVEDDDLAIVARRYNYE